MVRVWCGMALAVASLTLTGRVSMAQEESPVVVDLPNVAGRSETEFQNALEQFAELVAADRPFRVQATSRWKRVTGDNAVEGSESITLVRRGRSHLRLEIRIGEETEPAYLAAADGEKITIWLRADRLYEQEITGEPLRHLAGCSLSQGILESCGIDFLLAHDVADSVIAQLVSVEGTAAGDEAQAASPRFTATFQDGTAIAVEFQGESPAVPAKLKTERSLAVAEDLTSTLTIETELAWEFDVTEEPQWYQFEVPTDARRVSDLSDELNDGGSASLVGKALPALSLQPLDGDESVPLEIKKPTVLYFWATWAAPSIDEIPRLTQFVKDANEKGIQVIGVNLAEDLEHVREFVKLNRFEGEIRIDRTGQGAEALKLVELPAVVVTDASGKIIAVRENSAQEFEPELRKLLEMLGQ